MFVYTPKEGGGEPLKKFSKKTLLKNTFNKSKTK